MRENSDWNLIKARSLALLSRGLKWMLKWAFQIKICLLFSVFIVNFLNFQLLQNLLVNFNQIYHKVSVDDLNEICSHEGYTLL